ncbi:alpha/beta hydrolase [Phycicoccus sp. CSK15P-2]|uniref:alpha/beta hydrolase n=1 Tax=Phycicoccus sp. CSK15P-2 TaxID=2807627 RepID=UPI00195227C5|nr:alpha/beta fold hydrolase [Phycicoccus sp. CSK15P-2]MBM6402973.1 alpha/beta hydrolase [Phycicoccus sp. CSK15P-2]
MKYLLVPGAWHGGWAWHAVAQRLRTAGHEAECLTLPGMGDGEDRRGIGLADATRHIVSRADRQLADDLVLVGHSLGGLMISAAAEALRDRLRRLVFVDAFVPVPGRSMNDANAPEIRQYVADMVDGSADGTVGVPDYDLAKSALMQDLPDVAARLIYQLLTPTPGGYFLDPYPGPDVSDLGVALSYVLADDDQGLAVPGPDLAERLGVEPVSVPGTHEALLTHPDAVAEAILRLQD